MENNKITVLVNKRNPDAGLIPHTGIYNGDRKNITVYSPKQSALRFKTLIKKQNIFFYCYAILFLLVLTPCSPSLGASDFKKASEYFSKGRFNKAAKLYKSYLKKHPAGRNSIPSALGAGWCEFLQEHYYSSAVYLSKILYKTPEGFMQGIVPYLLASAYRRASDYEASVRLYLKLQKDFPENSWKKESNFYLSELYYKLKQPDKSIMYGDRFLSMNPGGDRKKKVLLYIADNYFVKKKYKKAAKTLEGYLKITGEPGASLDVWTRLAECYINLNDENKALLLCRALVRKYPDSPATIRAYLYLGQVEELKKNWKKSLYWYNRAISLAPDNPISRSAFYRLTQIYQTRMHNYSTVNKYYLKFFRHHPKDFRAIEGLLYAARNMQTLGSSEDAYLLLLYFLETYPEHEKMKFVHLMMAQIWNELDNKDIDYTRLEKIKKKLFIEKKTIPVQKPEPDIQLIVTPLNNIPRKINLDVYAYASMGLLRKKLSFINRFNIIPADTAAQYSYIFRDIKKSNNYSDTKSILIGGNILSSGDCEIYLIKDGVIEKIMSVTELENRSPFVLASQLYIKLYRKLTVK